MKLIKTPTKGMNDYLPTEVALREYVKSVIVSSYTADGFCMIETPAVEHIENLTGKNGGENKIMGTPRGYGKNRFHRKSK
jgi:histidyl-tRNA synthetase